MRLRTLAIGTVVALVSALLFSSAANAGEHSGRPLSAALRGSNEIPGPGDADGFGSAIVRLNPGQKEICFKIHVGAVTLPATAAHIHQGATAVAGPVVVTLTPPDASGNSSGCVSALRSLVLAILQHPAGYYVNVHTSDFPGGAVRGQLGRGMAASASSHTFAATLKGSNEVPGPGDPDGTGTASITIIPDQAEVCFTIHVSGIVLPATAAHIHQGPAGVAGAVVVTLAPPDAGGNASGCLIGQSHDLLLAIIANPSGYYVNVHTSDFPGGAVRGQLSAGAGEGENDQGEND